MRSDSQEKFSLRKRARAGYEVQQDYVLLRTANSLRLGLEEEERRSPAAPAALGFCALAFFARFKDGNIVSVLVLFRLRNSAQNAALDASLVAHIAENGHD